MAIFRGESNYMMMKLSFWRMVWVWVPKGAWPTDHDGTFTCITYTFRDQCGKFDSNFRDSLFHNWICSFMDSINKTCTHFIGINYNSIMNDCHIHHVQEMYRHILTTEWHRVNVQILLSFPSSLCYALMDGRSVSVTCLMLPSYLDRVDRWSQYQLLVCPVMSPLCTSSRHIRLNIA